MLKIINPNAHEEESKVGFSFIDKDGSGSINFDEFQKFITH